MTTTAGNCNFSHDMMEAMRKWIAVIALGITPILFLPVTQDFYDTNKLMFLTLSAIVLSIITGIVYLSQKKILTLSMPPATFGFVALFISSLISLFFASANKVEALMTPLGPVGILALIVILLILSKPSEELKTRLAWVFTGSTVILGLITIYQFVGMGHVMFPDVPFLQDVLWTPTGVTTTTIALFFISIAFVITQIRLTAGKPHLANSFVFYVASALVLAAALVITAIEFAPKIPTSVVPFSVAWAIALETMRHAKTAFVGVGAENFVSAYTLGKPAWMIATSLWNVRFQVNADFFLHFATIYGLAGVVAAFIFTWQFVKQFSNKSFFFVHSIYILCLLLVPPTLTMLTVGAILLVLSSSGNVPTKPLATPLRIVVTIVLLCVGIAGLYPLGRAYSGELEYFKALTYAQKNEGTNTYNQLIRAIQTDNYVSRYHITFSQVNLSLTGSVAAQKTLTDKDRQIMSTLVQQGISEAKAAVTLNPQSVTAWENLGNTYQAVIAVATGADTWAAASYQKALSLDPTNPVLLVNLGGVLVTEKKYDDAILLFERAAFLKPDYANAYYNLGDAYKRKGDAMSAKAALTKAMDLVPADSSDYFKAKNELDTLP